MHAKLEVPDSLDEATKSILIGLLERDPTKRLSDPPAIKAHPYFKGMDWEKLLRKEITPPFIPPVKNKEDVSMVDPAFTSEKPTDQTEGQESADAAKVNIDQKKFEGFTFIPENDIEKK